MSADYPKIQQGLGKFTPDLFARLMRMLEVFESDNGGGAIRKPGLNTLGQQESSLTGRWFVGFIESSTAIPGESNRYSYAFTESVAESFGDSGNFEFEGGGRGIAGTAFNIMEVNNTATEMKPGVDLSASDFPSGMSVQPIAVGSLVFIRAWKDKNGDTIFLFQAENAIDGSCS